MEIRERSKNESSGSKRSFFDIFRKAVHYYQMGQIDRISSALPDDVQNGDDSFMSVLRDGLITEVKVRYLTPVMGRETVVDSSIRLTRGEGGQIEEIERACTYEGHAIINWGECYRPGEGEQDIYFVDLVRRELALASTKVQ